MRLYVGPSWAKVGVGGHGGRRRRSKGEATPAAVLTGGAVLGGLVLLVTHPVIFGVLGGVAVVLGVLTLGGLALDARDKRREEDARLAKARADLDEVRERVRDRRIELQEEELGLRPRAPEPPSAYR